MQTHPVWNESLAFVFRRTTLNANCSATANVVDEIVALVDFGQPQEWQQLAVKRLRRFKLTNRQDEVGSAVDFNPPQAPSTHRKVSAR